MSADIVYKNDKRISYYIENAFAFIIFLKNETILFSNEQGVHGNIEIDLDLKEKYKIKGRLWLNEKIISFWNYDFSNMNFEDNDNDMNKNTSNNHLTFKETLKLIENKFNETKHYDSNYNELNLEKISIDSKWLIDVPLSWINKNMKKKTYNDFNNYYKIDNFEGYQTYVYYKIEYVLLPINEFEKRVKIYNDELSTAKNLHLMNYKDKKQYYKENPDNLPKNFGSYAKYNKVKGAKSIFNNREMTTAQWDYWHKRENNRENIKSFKLFESPDEPKSTFKDPRTNEITNLRMVYYDNDAFPFGYVNQSDLYIIYYKKTLLKRYNKLKLQLKDNNDIKTINTKIENIKEEISNHNNYVKTELTRFGVKNMTEFKKLPSMKFGNKKYIMYVGKIGDKSVHSEFGSDRYIQQLNGRIWYDKKFISFWKYPNTYEDLIKVIGDIETMYKIKYNKDLNILKNMNEWIIETLDDDVILLKDYKGGKSKYSEEELKAPHLMNWKEKNDWKKKQKFDEISAKKQLEKPIEWRNALGKFRGESKKYNDINYVIDIIKSNLLNEYDCDCDWETFIDEQEIGDCQNIVHSIMSYNIRGVEKHFGEIKIEYPFDDDDYDKIMTHHWITYNNEIIEFSKGTLKYYVDWNDKYSVSDDNEIYYNEIIIK